MNDKSAVSNDALSFSSGSSRCAKAAMLAACDPANDDDDDAPPPTNTDS